MLEAQAALDASEAAKKKAQADELAARSARPTRAIARWMPETLSKMRSRPRLTLRSAKLKQSRPKWKPKATRQKQSGPRRRLSKQKGCPDVGGLRLFKLSAQLNKAEKDAIHAEMQAKEAEDEAVKAEAAAKSEEAEAFSAETDAALLERLSPLEEVQKNRAEDGKALGTSRRGPVQLIFVPNSKLRAKMILSAS